MSDKFVKMDLHIHTPESKDYKGHKDDNEFLAILRSAKSKGLKIISLTDHNSIEGYRRLQRIKDNMVVRRNTLSAVTDSTQTTSQIKNLDKDLSLFTDLLILPGVEIEVKPGIHFLVIFDDNTRIESIERFISEAGYKPENFGEEDPSTLPRWDVIDLYQSSTKYNCLIIDAHTDSSKGIWNTLQRGSFRAKCLSASELTAACYKSEDQRENIKHILNSAIEYKRLSPLSFVRFSDAHIHSKVGSRLTWVRLDKVEYNSLRNALTNPSEMISTDEPSLLGILNDILAKENTFGVLDLSDESKDKFKILICALNNASGGYILIGVTEDKKKLGLSIDNTNSQKEHERIAQELASCFKTIEGRFKPSINLYELQTDRVILSVYISPGKSLINIKDDGCIYSVKNNKVLKLPAIEIQAIVEDRVMSEIESKINKRLTDVEKGCNLIKSTLVSLPILRTFEKNSLEARLAVSVNDSIELSLEESQKLKRISPNGTSRGNLFFLQEAQLPRLNYTYLRHSIPLFTIRNLKVKSVIKDTIYVVPGGGVYFSNRDYPFYSESNRKILKLYTNKSNAPYGMKFTVSFLKSSLWLWYCMEKFDETNIMLPEIFNSIRLPLIQMRNPTNKDTLSQIEIYFDQIMRSEVQYLIAVQKLKSNEEKIEITNQHNSRIDQLSYQIDRLIYSLFNYSSHDITQIEDNLKMRGIYIPAINYDDNSS